MPLPRGTKNKIIERWGSVTKAANAVNINPRYVYKHLEAEEAPAKYSKQYFILLFYDQPDNLHIKESPQETK